MNQRKEVISFSQRTMRYFMLFVLNLVLRAKVSSGYKANLSSIRDFIGTLYLNKYNVLFLDSYYIFTNIAILRLILTDRGYV